jgi:hypothetical protein
MNDISAAWQILEGYAASIGKQGGIINIFKSEFLS